MQMQNSSEAPKCQIHDKDMRKRRCCCRERMTVTNAWLGLEEVPMQTNTTIGCTRRPGLCLKNIGLIPYTGWMEWMSHRKRRETKQQPSMLPGLAVPGCCFVSFCFPHSIHSVLKLYNLYGKKIAQFISFVPTTYSPSAMSMHGATRRAFARTRGAISLPFPQFGMSRDRTRN